MSRELDILAHQFKNEPITVIRTDINLYQTTIQSASRKLLKQVELESKRKKNSIVTLVALIKNKI